MVSSPRSPSPLRAAVVSVSSPRLRTAAGGTAEAAPVDVLTGRASTPRRAFPHAGVQAAGAAAVPQAAARCARVLTWPVVVRDMHRQEHTGTVEDILARVEAVLAEGPEPCSLEVVVGGTTPAYLAGLQDRLPGDRDDLCRISPLAPSVRLDFGDLKRLVEPALARALEEVFGAPVPFVADERSVAGGTLFRARIGLPHAHVDLRFVLADSDVRPYDYVCNSLYVDRRDLHTGRAPPLRTFSDVPLKEVLDDLRRGRFSMDHALAGDSLMRDWKMRTRGFVPNLPSPDATATRGHFEALLPTLIATLREQGAGEGMTLPYATAELVRRARGLAGAGPTDPASRPALALVANAVVSLAVGGIGRASLAPEVELLQRELRRNLDSCTRVAELGGASRYLVEQLQDDAHLQALILWLHAVAAPEGAFDPRVLPARYEVAHVETPGGASLRVYLPELRSYVVLPDRPAIAAGAHDTMPDIQRLVGAPAPEAVRE
ncbi:MAG TPA: hypothetical protein VFH51_18290, partial [Myxococcota bacterium]|nr:hypothetical protein [Myxococcota bacterium]